MKTEKPFCQSFRRNPDGSWTSIHQTTIDMLLFPITLNAGIVFRPGEYFMGEDMVTRIERECVNPDSH